MSTEKSEQQRQFESLQREILVSAREQGGDPDDNFRLRLAIRRARDINMPEDAIERARLQGTGEIEGPDYQEKIFEGYGPAGVAVMVEAITDEPRRMASDLEELFESHGGNLGDEGTVRWQFERRGVVDVEAQHVDDPDEFMLEVIELGGEELDEPLPGDVRPMYRIFCDPTDVSRLSDAVQQASYPVLAASVVYEPTQYVSIDADAARRFVSFFEKLLAEPGVRAAYANWRAA